jgi:two-component sensor histidine kinase
MKKRTLSILVFLFFISKSFCNTSNNSLQNDFLLKNDIDKVSFYKTLSENDKLKNITFFSNQFQKLNNSYTHNNSILKEIKFTLASIYILQKNHLKSITILNEIIDNKKLNISSKDSIETYVALQESYLKLNLYTKVFEINKKINLLISRGVYYPLWSYNIQSRLYLQLQQHQKAILQLKKEIVTLYKNPKRDSLIIPSAYNDLGYYNSLIKNNKQALSYYRESLKIAEKSLKPVNYTNYKNITITVNSNIAQLYLNEEKYKEAISIIENKVIPFIDKVNDNHNLIDSQLILADAFLHLNDFNNYKKHIFIIEKSLEIDKRLDVKLKFLDLSTNYYEKIKDYKSSVFFYKNILSLKDSINSARQKNIYLGTEISYFLETKEKELNNKNEIIKRNEKIILIGTIFSLLIIITIGFYLISNHKKKRKIIEKMNISIIEKNNTIENSLKEKELLLKEIHHRVKNNLQVISGILDLQNFSIKDDEVKNILKEGQNRIQAIAMLHKTMYQNENFNKIDFKSYLIELIQYIKNTNRSLNKNIQTILEIDNINFDIDIAVPLSLIINEAINNCFKHAFNSVENGIITIAITKNDATNYSLSIHDNGIGLPFDFDIDKSSNVGLDLMRGLSQQLNGSLVVENNNGTQIFILFKDTK